MFLGNVGSSHRLAFIVIVTEVNIAQRLAEEALSGQILITERVYRKLDDSFQVRLQSHHTLRGMEFGDMVYSMLSIHKEHVIHGEEL